MKTVPISGLFLTILALCLSACSELDADSHVRDEHEQHSHAGHSGEAHTEHAHRILVTSPVEQDVISTQQYVCQIHSCRHIEVCSLEGGYLEEIHVQEGQTVKKGDLMFEILPTLHQARLDSEVAEAELAQIELNNSRKLYEDHVVSNQDVALAKAKLAKAQANAELARAELNFTEIKAPFDGIVDRQLRQQGSLIEEGEMLTTLSDNSVMWAYFNMPEARYLEYKAELEHHGDVDDDDGDDDQDDDDQDDEDDDDQDDDIEGIQIDLVLANGETFSQHGAIGAIEADFNNETGNIAFRADFPNPAGLLRNGQTGTVMIHRELDDVIVIPQRATFEILAKRYAFVVDEEGVVHQRDITIQNELDDIFVIKDGLAEGDKIILEGIRQVRDGEKIEYEYLEPEEVLKNLKFHAE